MSAASSAAVRRPASAPAPQARQPPRASPAFFASAAQDSEELRLNLSDLPHMEQSLDVEGFKPSLLSRLFDLIAPVRAR